MPNPWVSLVGDQLIPVNKAVNEKEQSEKGLEEEEKKGHARLLGQINREPRHTRLKSHRRSKSRTRVNAAIQHMHPFFHQT
jgi:hypothetical protein